MHLIERKSPFPEFGQTFPTPVLPKPHARHLPTLPILPRSWYRHKGHRSVPLWRLVDSVRPASSDKSPLLRVPNYHPSHWEGSVSHTKHNIPRACCYAHSGSVSRIRHNVP